MSHEDAARRIQVGLVLVPSISGPPLRETIPLPRGLQIIRNTSDGNHAVSDTRIAIAIVR
jgi:hypothetical protein